MGHAFRGWEQGQVDHQATAVEAIHGSGKSLYRMTMNSVRKDRTALPRTLWRGAKDQRLTIDIRQSRDPVFSNLPVGNTAIQTKGHENKRKLDAGLGSPSVPSRTAIFVSGQGWFRQYCFTMYNLLVIHLMTNKSIT